MEDIKHGAFEAQEGAGKLTSRSQDNALMEITPENDSCWFFTKRGNVKVEEYYDEIIQGLHHARY
jgi:hypothetical protein